MNQIGEKQNEPDILKFLFSARFYMNKASFWKNIEIFSVVLLIILKTIPIENITKDWVLTLISVIGLFFFNFMYKKNIEIGALTKEYIDCKLYNIKSENLQSEDTTKIIEYKLKAIKKSKPLYYKEQINNNGTSKKRGVKDWYSVEKELNLNDAIQKCQSENIYWDNNLVKKYRIALTILTIFLAVILVFQKNYLYLITSISCLVIIITELCHSFKYTNTYTKIKTKLDYSSGFTDKSQAILDIQKDIFERRKIFIIPDFFHKISTIELHSSFSEIEKKKN